jgi:L-ascorbate metabolism protein UlaG (beta-lactamase superfamily)
MLLTYFGHSCFLLEHETVRIVFDPFLKANPHGAVEPASVPCTHVLCSHAHDDHIADALDLARAHRATIVAPFELANHFAQHGATTLDLLPGGGIDLPWGRIQMTPALHSSSLELPNGESRGMGVASGFLVRLGAKTIYHAGDTGLFGDMALIGRRGIDLALIPIGDFYTMGPADAIDAIGLLRPRLTVPMHYNTFPPIRQDPHAFAQQAVQSGHPTRVMKPGETLDLSAG